MLIIGGGGFVGRHLACAIQAHGKFATVVSRQPPERFFEEYAPNVRAVTLDDFRAGREAYLRAVDTLVYMASTSVPATNKNQPWVELPDNVVPAFQLIAEAVEANPDIRLVYLSSGGTVYGAGYRQPVKESDALEPISPYGYGKLAAEECIRYLGRTKNLSYAILRVANPVGQWQSNPRQGIVSVAIQAALEGKPITLYNGGEQVRDFLDADDVADAILAAADARDFRHHTWNVGSGVGRRIVDVVQLVEEVTGRCLEKTIVTGRAVDADYSVLDCSLIRSDLGWSAKVALEDSVGNVWRFRRR